MELLIKDFPDEAYALLVERANRKGKTLGEEITELVFRCEGLEQKTSRFPGALERMNRLVEGTQPLVRTIDLIREDRASH